MGNFEKLGILVIIILVVVIMVLSIWGGPVPSAEPLPYENPLNLSSSTVGGDSTPLQQPPAQEPPADEEDLPDFAPDDRDVGTEPPGEGPPAGPPAVRPQEDLVHVVSSKDTFFSLARHYYGDARYYKEIRDANPAVKPTNMQLGTKLAIPHPDRVRGGGTRETVRESRPEESAPGFYVVQKNDSLAKISRKVLGSEARWKSIWEANRDKIGDDPTRIQPGWRLRIPR